MKASRFFNSFKFAVQGIGSSWKKEQNMRIHFLAALVVLIAGALSGLSKGEWIIIILLVGGMIALEVMNSAIERVVDLASPEIHPLAKEAKDMAAGAVLVFAAASAIIGLLIFIPKWF
ncbi:diacylglycerol kinase family protein [Planococcus shenhongbingii]|uniref:Diacylglycerol kinase family protein n=1 Tax=Planococcus shenhongbingii TaxID=3058398 RepID=A0ABT8NE67_9BACL|nr:MULTISPECIES: diacylglycerol kinase family protein [unclassified Planococcus (in: firmicutes)]MDN7245795.1 diacylglycerol kinase family protein [Planococcus sp. N017]WKA60091.1 diacylglycerol kinase family protein [Planococcus sp. N016]